MVMPFEEKVTIDIPIGETTAMQTMTIVMMPKSKIANFKKDNPTISAVTSEIQNSKYPDGFSILADTPDLVPLVLSRDSRLTLKKYEKYLDLIHINNEFQEQPEL